MISRRTLPTLLTALLFLSVVSLGFAQASGNPLTDTQAQALIQRFQAQPSTPLTRTENQSLLKYLIAKNSQQSAAAIQPQTQTVVAVHAIPAVAPVPEPPKPKATRIGLALPKADLGQGFQGQSAGESMRSLIAQYLNSPKIEVVTLTALLESQVDAEAKEKGCDYIIYSSMIQKRAVEWAF